jgi:hypothetical protein
LFFINRDKLVILLCADSRADYISPKLAGIQRLALQCRD